jgi:hypothetical protein
MILAQATFYGHMGSGSQVDGSSDMPKEPADGWYVMPASYANGRTNFDLKAREMACKPSGSVASNNALPSPRSLQGSTIASRGTPTSSDDKMLASDLQNCDRLAQQQSEAAMTLTPVAPVSVLSPILLLNDINKRKQEEENQPAALANIEGQRLQCRKGARRGVNACVASGQLPGTFLRFLRMDADPQPRFHKSHEPARSIAYHQKCEREQGVIIDRRLLPRIDDRGFLQHFGHADDAADGGILKGDQRLREKRRQHPLQCLRNDDVTRGLKPRQSGRDACCELVR